MRTSGTVDDWYREHEGWPDEVATLRRIVLAAGLDETLKWGQPAYTDRGKTVLLVSARRGGAVVSFLRGALLDDPEGLLIVPGEHSRSARYLLFNSTDEIAARRTTLEALIEAAIAIVRAGRRIEPLPDEIDDIDELRQHMVADESFRVAFEQLTPGRRRGYNLHFGRAKQSSTRVARIAQCTERILMGKGLLDCVCGRSKRPPGCDGSHKTPAA